MLCLHHRGPSRSDAKEGVSTVSEWEGGCRCSFLLHGDTVGRCSQVKINRSHNQLYSKELDQDFLQKDTAVEFFRCKFSHNTVWTAREPSSYIIENSVDNKNWHMPHVFLNHAYVPQGWISWKRILAWAHCFQRVLNDSVEPGAQEKKKKNLHTASCNIKTELCQRETVWSNHKKKKKEEKKTHFGLHVVNSVKL